MNEVLKHPIVVIGIGEIGSVFARGFLRMGRPVYPVTRDMDMSEVAEAVPEPGAVLLAVGENELHPMLQRLQTMPDSWKAGLILIQNELLPRDWLEYGLNPTVASIWFEKKKGQDVKVVVASPVHGAHSALVSTSLATLDIPCEIIDDPEKMTFELVRKNYYILTTNIAGLKVAKMSGNSHCTVSELWRDYRDVAQSVIDDVHAIQEFLVGAKLDKQALTDAMLIAFDGDPDHGCMGRSAPARLQRALQIAQQANIETPTLRQIAAEVL